LQLAPIEMASSIASRAVCLLLISLALCHAVAGQATPAQQIVQAFEEVTTLSANLRDQTQEINHLNALFEGPKIPQGFSVIVNRVAAASSMISNSNPPMIALGDADAKTVVSALTTFVKVHQELLSVVIGKHGLLTLFLFSEPIRQALVSLEGTVDTFAFVLIAVIPTQQPAANQQFSSLDVTVRLAITTYSP
jgi:hypothetical protein